MEHQKSTDLGQEMDGNAIDSDINSGISGGIDLGTDSGMDSHFDLQIKSITNRTKNFSGSGVRPGIWSTVNIYRALGLEHDQGMYCTIAN